MAKPVEVKPAEGIDVAVLLDIFNSSRADARCYSRADIDIESFSALIAGEEIHVAVLDSTIIGFVSVWVTDQFVHHLYVLPEYQRRGAASALLKLCEQTYGLPLSLKCDVCNERAQRFYRAKGWLPVEKGFGTDGPWERLRLARA